DGGGDVMYRRIFSAALYEHRHSRGAEVSTRSGSADLRRAPAGPGATRSRTHCGLLHLDGSALLLELRLDLLGLFLRHAFLDGLGRVVDEVLGFLQAQAGQLAHDLDHLDLLGARLLEDDVELGLLLDGSGRSCTGA